MNGHKNAKLTLQGRKLLVKRINPGGQSRRGQPTYFAPSLRGTEETSNFCLINNLRFSVSTQKRQKLLTDDMGRWDRVTKSPRDATGIRPTNNTPRSPLGICRGMCFQLIPGSARP
ncbi:MAG: hypothetical protein FWD67_10190 [Betaproteobacteria bacterium]|nr:hypothetical protein [Betaproteobacteria bacterium]